MPCSVTQESLSCSGNTLTATSSGLSCARHTAPKRPLAFNSSNWIGRCWVNSKFDPCISGSFYAAAKKKIMQKSMFAFGLARQSNKYKPLELRWTAHSSYSYTKMQPKTGWPQQMRCRIQCRRLAKSWARRPSLGTGCFPGFSVQRLAPVYSWCCTCGRYNSRSSSSSNCCCRCILYCCTWCRWNSLSFERVFVLFVGVWVWHQ